MVYPHSSSLTSLLTLCPPHFQLWLPSSNSMLTSPSSGIFPDKARVIRYLHLSFFESFFRHYANLFLFFSILLGVYFSISFFWICSTPLALVTFLHLQIFRFFCNLQHLQLLQNLPFGLFLALGFDLLLSHSGRYNHKSSLINPYECMGRSLWQSY